MRIVHGKDVFEELVNLSFYIAQDNEGAAQQFLGACDETFTFLAKNKNAVKAITSDNGREFARHQLIAQQLQADFYFAPPYASWERGLCENTNGLVRQYFPKKSDFSKITDRQIKQVVERLNHRPRKTLGYKTPNEVFFKLPLVALTT